MNLTPIIRDLESKREQLTEALDTLYSLNRKKPGRPRKKLHWTQTPEGRRKLANRRV